jgi:polyphosphate kinase 2 (PPK2 family)
LLYTYVLDCPWQTVPAHEKLTARIVFTDALTHRIFSVDRDVKVEPPGK